MLPEGYEIRALTDVHAPLLADAYRRNRAYLAPWEPVRAESFYTEEGQAAAVKVALAAAARGTLDPSLIVRDGAVVGRGNLSNIARGVFLSSQIGFWTDQAHAGRGLATSAVKLRHTQGRRAGVAPHRGGHPGA